METTQKGFERAVAKGEYGERIVREYLESKGYVVYFPFTKDRAHAFDMLATLDKKRVIGLDVKAKARMNKWRKTGINESSYNEYLAFSKSANIPFYLVFVDEHPKEMSVYGGEISAIGKPEIIEMVSRVRVCFWYLDKFKKLFDITPEMQAGLIAYSQRRHDYK
jgi:hypothetical protein